MSDFLFESIRGQKINTIGVNKVIKEQRTGLGNHASLHLNKNGGFFIYLLIDSLTARHVEEFNKGVPEFRIFTRNDKSYMLVHFTSNLPIFEFLFDVSVYKTLINQSELENILTNIFNVALVNGDDTIVATKKVVLDEKLYSKFRKSIISAYQNPNFALEYRVFLIPFYEKSTDRWWNIIKE